MRHESGNCYTFAKKCARMHAHAHIVMRIFKKLDMFILRDYLLLFAGTFFICLFIFMMQFMWRYVDELVGKGLSWEVLAKFFYYSGLTLVPISLPLAVLLASLISFGNMGERLELLAMKASGIPLVRILQPVLLFAACVCLWSFYFQNKVGPEATKQLATLVWSMKQKSPELEIPEGIFYNEIPGYNLYVHHKDARTGMLYGVIIYSNTDGYEDAQIVLADSARLQSTADKCHLKLTLMHGERFRNMDSQGGGNMLRASVPYMRESFVSEVDLIPFDANFNLMDANLFSGNAQTKGLREIRQGIDSLRHVSDSTGHAIASAVMSTYLNKSLPVGYRDSLRVVEASAECLPLDTLYAQLSDEQRATAWRSAQTHAESLRSEYEFRSIITSDINMLLRRHRMEEQKKFTLSLACLLFFFIGAPLGAIIRKGGLGLPVVISVLIFIFYYIVNVAGEKMAKTGEWNVLTGIWLSSAVLLPVGVFLTNRANKDSVVFNIEGYRAFFRRLFGLRASRAINRKEVVIHEPEYRRIAADLDSLSALCLAYNQETRLTRMPSYAAIFFRYREDRGVEQISERLEQLIDELHNSRDSVILMRINEYPILETDAHTRPFRSARKNMAVGLFLPLGLLFWLRIWRYRLRLWRDIGAIRRIDSLIIDRINKQQYE